MFSVSKADSADQGNRPVTLNPRCLLGLMTEEELFAAARFNETVEDDGSFDIDRSMLKRLVEFGLVRHAGRGFYEQTDGMVAIRADLARLTAEPD